MGVGTCSLTMRFCHIMTFKGVMMMMMVIMDVVMSLMMMVMVLLVSMVMVVMLVSMVIVVMLVSMVKVVIVFPTNVIFTTVSTAMRIRAVVFMMVTVVRA